MKKLDSSWKGSHDGFLIWFEQELIRYKELVPACEYYKDNQKRTMLEAAVSPQDHLNSVMNQADVVTLATGGKLDYKKYLSLLKAAAQKYDHERLKVGNSRHRVNKHAWKIDFDYVDRGGELFMDSWQEEPEEVIQFGPETPSPPHLLQYQARRGQDNGRDTRPRTDRPTIPEEYWKAIPYECQLWYIGKTKAKIDTIIENHKRRKQQANMLFTDSSQINNAPVASNEPTPPPLFDVPTVSPMTPEYRQQVIQQNYHNIDSLMHGSSNTPSTVVMDISADSQSRVTPTPAPNIPSPHNAMTANEAADIRRVLSTRHSRQDSVPPSTPAVTPTQVHNNPQQFLTPDGFRYMRINTHRIYRASNAIRRHKDDSLVDRGANGGFAGNDVRVLEHTMHKVDVHGIENHKVQGVPIGTVAGLVETHRCKVILIMHQYAIYGKGRTIHSSGQLEHFGNKVDDRSRVVGGKQRITTLEGYVIPLQIREGLAHFHMTPPTDDDLDTYPHVILTSDNDWDPTLLDNEIDIENITREFNDLPPENVYGDI